MVNFSYEVRTVNRITEQIETPLIDTYDTVVVGGGVAGVAAALAAARHGSRVLLIEKQTVLGGLATAGHIIIYLPLCDGLGNKVIGGISEELLWESIRYGKGTLDPAWHSRPMHADTDKRYETVFNAGEFAFRLEELLEEAGVALLYDTVLVNVAKNGKRIDAVIVENKSGRQAYGCKAVVDASGDGDVFARFGADFGEQDNFLAYWSYYADDKKDEKLKIMTVGSNTGGGLPEGARKYRGTDVTEVTEFLKASHALGFERIKHGKNGEVLASFPSMAQFRTTRRLIGAYTMTHGDLFRHQEDSVGCAGDWRKREDVYEIPYRALYTEQIDNLFAAGRNISSEGDTWEVTRVIPVAAATGHAAGIAAAMIAESGKTAKELPIAPLQNALAADGVILHYNREHVLRASVHKDEAVRIEGEE